jgi:hypothetical protein
MSFGLMYIVWKTYSHLMWISWQLMIKMRRVWKSYPPGLRGRGEIIIPTSRLYHSHFQKLSTFDVDNLVEKCAEVTALHSN